MIGHTSSDIGDASDGVLQAAARLGDPEAFDAIVNRYGPVLYRYARRMLSGEADAADVVQETFVAAWGQLSTFRGASSLRTWLFSICARKVVDTYRVKRAQPVEDWVLEPQVSQGSTLDPFAAVSNAAFLAALEQALAELPPRQRAAWLMREIELMSFPEIGDVLRLSSDAVRGHHHRATATLRILLRRWQ